MNQVTYLSSHQRSADSPWKYLFLGRNLCAQSFCVPRESVVDVWVQDMLCPHWSYIDHPPRVSSIVATIQMEKATPYFHKTKSYQYLNVKRTKRQQAKDQQKYVLLIMQYLYKQLVVKKVTGIQWMILSLFLTMFQKMKISSLIQKHLTKKYERYFITSRTWLQLNHL